MNHDVCYIVGAGEYYGFDFVPSAKDLIIAADAGIRCLEQHGIPADLVIGDFDSLGHIPTHTNIKALHPEKDETDMLAAVREGIAAGYTDFHIYCGTGGRMDHTIANIQTLAALSCQNMRGFLFDRDNVITAITNTRIAFDLIQAGYVSVFSYTEKCTGVYLHGLKYELSDAVLTSTFPLGVSNEFIGKESSIAVREGTLLVVFPRETLTNLRYPS